MTIREDPTAPESPDSVLSTVFPTGLVAGSAPVNWGGWDAGDQEKRSVYLRMWIKIVGPDFENQSVGTKAGFIAFGLEPGARGNAENQSVLHLNNGTGKQAIQQAMEVDFKQFAIPGPDGIARTRVMYQNVTRRKLMTCGGWHQWEVLLELNAMGQANGKFKMWIDGTKTHDYADVIYVTPKTPHGFRFFKWNPTWGGQGGKRTRNDSILIDHIYISGLP